MTSTLLKPLVDSWLLSSVMYHGGIWQLITPSFLTHFLHSVFEDTQFLVFLLPHWLLLLSFYVEVPPLLPNMACPRTHRWSISLVAYTHCHINLIQSHDFKFKHWNAIDSTGNFNFQLRSLFWIPGLYYQLHTWQLYLIYPKLSFRSPPLKLAPYTHSLLSPYQ